MNSMEDVPFKIPLGALGEVKEEVDKVTVPDVIVLDYLKILQETEYVPSLENWVLTGLQGGYATQPQAPVPCSPSDVLPSCPPYWMMFSSPQESRLASRWSSDLWEPNPLRRCHSLNARVRFTISDSEDDDGGNSDSQSAARRPCGVDTKGPAAGSSRRFLDLSGSQRIPAQPVPPKQQQQQQQNQRKTVRQMSLSARNPPRAPPQRSFSLFGCRLSPSNQSSVKASRKSQAQAPNVLSKPRNTKPPVPSQGSHPRPPPAVSEPRPLGSHTDSSAELLSALSEEERDLVEAIMAHGYTLRTAIISLQKTREHSSEQIVNYLVACDRLCKLGYEEAEVEEALEMFQNSETKAAEFLHLLTQFNEMGFQENAIKEVLLMHENHCERALEELMTRVA